MQVKQSNVVGEREIHMVLKKGYVRAMIFTINLKNNYGKSYQT
jgi:hypothetical protein